MTILRSPLGLVLALLIFAAAAQPALAAPPLPRIGAVYQCSGAGGWDTVKFDRLTAFGPNLHRGILFLNGDNKKVDLAYDPAKNRYGWEFVMPLDNLSCRDLRVLYRQRVLDFNQCSDGIRRICYR